MDVITCYMGLARPFTIALPTQSAPKLKALYESQVIVRPKAVSHFINRGE